MNWVATIGGALALAVAANGATAPSPAPVQSGPELMVGALRFDPHGADFRPWIERFRDEIYAKWALQAAELQLGDRGRVELDFTVGRSGHVERARVAQASGPERLRHAAEATIRAMTLLPLPPAYKPRNLKLRAVLAVGEQP